MNNYNELFFKNFFKIITASIIILTFTYILTPFLVPFLFGGIFAMALSPFLSYFMTQKGLSRTKSLLLLSFGIFILGGIPFIIFCIRGARIITNFFSQKSFSVFTHTAQDKIYAIIDNFAEFNGLDNLFLREKFITTVNSGVSFFFGMFSDFLSKIPDLVLFGIIMSMSFYFFLIKEDQIRAMFDKYSFFQGNNGSRFISKVKASCREVFFSNVITGIIQSSIVSIGALICGIGDFYIIFVVTFIFSFIPVIGAGPVAFTLGIYSLIDGRVGAGVTMIIIGAIAGVTDNLIRPYLTSRGEIEVPPYVVFVAVIGGVLAMGLPGLFVGPLLASLLFGAVPVIIEEYFPSEEVQKNGEACADHIE